MFKLNQYPFKLDILATGPLPDSDWPSLPVHWLWLVGAERGVLASSLVALSGLSLCSQCSVRAGRADWDGRACPAPWAAPCPAAAPEAIPPEPPPPDQERPTAQISPEKTEIVPSKAGGRQRAQAAGETEAEQEVRLLRLVSGGLREERLRQWGGGGAGAGGETVEEAVRQDQTEPGGGPAGEQQEGRAGLSDLSQEVLQHPEPQVTTQTKQDLVISIILSFPNQYIALT